MTTSHGLLGFPPPQGGTGRNRVWRLLGLLPVALLVGCAPAPPAPASAGPAELPTVVVTVVPLQTRPVARTVAAVGTLNGLEEATLAPKVDGRVVAIHADVGDVVEPGAPLLDLDPTDSQLAVAEAKQGLLTELAKLGLTQLPPEGFDVGGVPSVRRSAVAQEDAARRLKVKRDLLARNVASRDEFDLAETDQKLAEATTAQTVAEARAVVAAARLRKAALDTAEQKLADCRLRAPVPALLPPGSSPAAVRYVVAQRLLSEGEMVRSMPVTNAFKLVVSHALKLRAAVPERHTPDVKVGQAVDMTVDAYPGVTFAGKVARVNPTVDAQNRTFEVEVAVPNADGRLRCGGFARAAIRVRTDPAVKTVPPEAVVTFAGVTKLFVAEAGKARAVPVEVGTREKDWVEAVGDVPADATVIVSGLSQLVDGSPVKVREESQVVKSSGRQVEGSNTPGK